MSIKKFSRTNQEDETFGIADMALIYATPVMLISVVFYLFEQSPTNFSKMLYISGGWLLILLVRMIMGKKNE